MSHGHSHRRHDHQAHGEHVPHPRKAAHDDAHAGHDKHAGHSVAMFRNMTNSLLRHELITTTLPKAKELRRVVEPMITLGKTPSLSNRRLAFNRLRDREMVSKLFGELGPRYAKRNGGYLRILKSGFRKGDNAPMALVSLLDRPDLGEGQGEAKKADKKEAAKAA